MAQSVLTRTPPPADARVPHGDDPLQFADIRLPAGAGPHPCVIVVHGGFWRNAYSLEHIGHLCAAFADAGVASWSLEYRRVGDAGGGWPGTFTDVVAGSRYLFDHVARLGIDPGRVAVTGHSAGGHLAAWLASLGSVPLASEIAAEPLPLRGAVPLAGLLDLRETFALGLSSGAVGLLIGETPDDAPERYAAASPIALTPPAVPVVAIHGEADDVVPFAFSEAYVAAMNGAGGVATLQALAGMGHFEPIDPESEAWPVVRDAVRSMVVG